MKDNKNSIKYGQSNGQEIKYFSYYEEYYLTKENIIYKIIIDRNNEEVFIKCKKYMISLNINDISSLANAKFISINDAYIFIFNFFEDNKVIIKDIIKYMEIKLILSNDERKIELTLKYNKINIRIKSYNNNDIEEIKKEINN